MGYKIRDDAPTALSLPAPIGGGDFGPTTEQVVYDIGEPIPHITTDIVDRLNAGDEHLLKFIEEYDGETIEVEPKNAPGDPTHEQSIAQLESLQAGPSLVNETPAAEVVAEPVSPDAEIGETTVADEAEVVEGAVSADNPFAS